jgi:hypothetical protein
MTKQSDNPRRKTSRIFDVAEQWSMVWSQVLNLMIRLQDLARLPLVDEELDVELE